MASCSGVLSASSCLYNLGEFFLFTSKYSLPTKNILFSLVNYPSLSNALNPSSSPVTVLRTRIRYSQSQPENVSPGMRTWPTLDQLIIWNFTLEQWVMRHSLCWGCNLELAKSNCYHLGRSHEGIKSTENRKMKQDILATWSEQSESSCSWRWCCSTAFSYRSQHISFSGSSWFRFSVIYRQMSQEVTSPLWNPSLLSAVNWWLLWCPLWEQLSDFDCETEQNNSCRLSTASSQESHVSASIYSSSLPFILLWMRKSSPWQKKAYQPILINNEEIEEESKGWK